jgi:HlyD family secretion protein
MRTIVIILIVLAVLVGLGVVSYQPMTHYWEMRSMPKWRLAEMAEGDIVAVRNATGTIKPVLQVTVGAFVSGPIDASYQLVDMEGNKLVDKDGRPLNLAEFNQEVKAGQVLAKIEPRIYAATKAMRQAEVTRAEALRDQAYKDLKRAEDLHEENSQFISQAEIDKVNFNHESLKAQVEMANAQLELAEANVKYTDIVAPVDGIIINRKIEPGQTLAAQFQTPELFVIAPDMRKKMHVHASVDEADMGLIKMAQQKRLPVTFTVDSYPDKLFTGVIEEIRLSSTTTQNVVTYPVVVAAENPDLDLLPGMTANISFEVDRRTGVLKIPNSALRFFPMPQHVRTEDKKLLEGKLEEQQPPEAGELQETGLSAEERSEARRKRNIRHVWVVEGFKLRAVEVVTGLSEGRYTELVSGNLKLGDKLVTGIETPQNWGG